MRLFVSQRRAVHRPRLIGQQGMRWAEDIGSAIVLVALMWLCIVGLPKLFAGGPNGLHICFVNHCPTATISTRH